MYLRAKNTQLHCPWLHSVPAPACCAGFVWPPLDRPDNIFKSLRMCISEHCSGKTFFFFFKWTLKFWVCRHNHCATNVFLSFSLQSDNYRVGRHEHVFCFSDVPHVTAQSKSCNVSYSSCRGELVV